MKAQWALALLLGCAAQGALAADDADDSLGVRWIELSNINTHEVLKVTFHDAHGFIPEALAKLQHLLRDYRTGEEHAIDTGLLVQLTDLARAAGQEPRYEVISGYRSPGTNSSLRAKGHHVAEHSLHMEGRAMDVRLNAVELTKLRDLALAAKRGGVGFYPKSKFVHIDTGRVRAWQDD